MSILKISLFFFFFFFFINCLSSVRLHIRSGALDGGVQYDHCQLKKNPSFFFFLLLMNHSLVLQCSYKKVDMLVFTKDFFNFFISSYFTYNKACVLPVT